MTANDGQPGRLRVRDVRRRFDRAADAFPRADFVHRQAATGLLERMSPMLLDPRHILDAGAATGAASRVLAKRFRGARVISLDASFPMLRQARRSRSRFSSIREVQADAVLPPLRSGSMDLVFANMLLPWVDDAPALFTSVARILRKGGLFAFSSLGPDSLAALREAWQSVDDGQHVITFSDMHEIGDALVKCGLREPVLDVDWLTVTYDDLPSLFADLTATGSRNTLRGRRGTLTGRRPFERLRQSLAARFGDGPLEFPLEMVFGHAWGGGPLMPPGEYVLDAATIGRRRR
jgi:malonyl-CoA O-methyltransferase